MSIPAVTTVRDLGIYFSSQLSFTHHHALIIRKAHQRINIFFSVLKYASWKVFIKCYVVYIRPLLEYGTVVTSPIQKENVIMLESVQKSFIFRVYKKFKMSYSSYFEALEECDLKSLEHRRLCIDLIFTYKLMVTKEIIIDDPIFEFLEHSRLRRHRYYLKSLTTNSNKLSSQILSNRVLRCWNSLSELVFPVKPSTAVFKSRICKYDLNHFLSLNPTNY
ncbi:hypothetical protein CRE_31008 [Caenorhabditis remanei]|uniref:Uncharacterized protein n=1 Tax=Caenorhabditis remanei TaxID=31234 RepID=E3LU27_CAERE|nr:hypothetical protein CRE_31008 [Caenorhabditis remanei]